MYDIKSLRFNSPSQGKSLTKSQECVEVTFLWEQLDTGVLELFRRFNLVDGSPLEDRIRILETLKRHDAADVDPSVILEVQKVKIVFLPAEFDSQREVAFLVDVHRLDGVLKAAIDVGIRKTDSENKIVKLKTVYSLSFNWDVFSWNLTCKAMQLAISSVQIFLMCNSINTQK